jgi:tryptophan-rich sensory protein
MFVKSLVTTGLLTAAAATAGSLASQEVKGHWYRTLHKPSIQPPRAAFPVVWTALYADIALTSAGVLAAGSSAGDGTSERERTDAAEPVAAQAATGASRGYLGALIVNLLLNAGWSWSFFRLRNLPLSLGVAAALTVSCVDLVRRAARVRAGLGWLLAPYAAWCAFATVLTARIRTLNE